MWGLSALSKRSSGVRAKRQCVKTPLATSADGLDVEALRADTPGVEHVLHLNNAGCSLPATPVTNAVSRYMHTECTIGGYEAAERPETALMLDAPYSAIAQLLNCSPRDVAVHSSATAAWHQIVLGLPLWRPGSRILTSVAEYGSNFVAYLQIQKRFGTTVEVIRETADRDIDVEHLEELLGGPAGQDALTVVSISHVPTSSGRVYDAAAVGRVVREHPGVVYVLDACQSVGQMPVDVQDIGCHFLTATGRKYLRAPRGSGFLYAAPDMLESFEPAALDVRGAVWDSRNAYRPLDSALRYEEYEMSFAARAGLGVACQYALDVGLDGIWDRVQRLAAHLRAGLASVPGVCVQDRGAALCGIVSFTTAGISEREVKDALRDCCEFAPEGINVSVSMAPSSRLDFDARGLDAVVRASPHYYNTEAELDAFVAAVRSVVAGTQDD